MQFTSPALPSAAVKRTVIAEVVILMLSGMCAFGASDGAAEGSQADASGMDGDDQRDGASAE